ncbi:MAG TPA: hypothetical protein VME70_00045 [Mycobacteriales bacterium]|nr:hypothetical protein [Mycobacteriales bacterium]
MRRLFWIAFGAVVGVLVFRRVSEAAAKWTPEGLALQAGGMRERVSDWWQIVKAGAAARERELRDALGIDDESEHSAA